MLVKEKSYLGEPVRTLEDSYPSSCFRVWIVLEKSYPGTGRSLVRVLLTWKMYSYFVAILHVDTLYIIWLWYFLLINIDMLGTGVQEVYNVWT